CVICPCASSSPPAARLYLSSPPSLSFSLIHQFTTCTDICKVCFQHNLSRSLLAHPIPFSPALRPNSPTEPFDHFRRCHGRSLHARVVFGLSSNRRPRSRAVPG